MGTVIQNVQRRVGSDEKLVGGEYDQGVHQTVILPVCRIMLARKETGWGTKILYWL